MPRRAALALGLLLAATVALGGPLPFVLQIEAPPELAAASARVGAEAPSLEAALELLGDLPLPERVRVILATEGSDAAHRVPSWVSGFAVPPLDTIVIFPARVPSYPDHNLSNLLTHELVHLLVHRAGGGAELPRWFEEGVATVAAREWGIEDAARFAAAVIGPGPNTLRRVDAGFTADTPGVTRSYAMSAALVRHFLRKGGADAVARLLGRVRRGEPFELAFERVAGLPLDAFETDFFGREVFWRTWVPFLSSSAALWMLITGLVLLAGWRRRRRDAALRELWLEEEELAVFDPEEEPRPDELVN